MARSWFRKTLSTMVAVQLRDGATLRGFLTGVYKRELVLERARLLGVDGDHELAGTTAIPRENVAFVYVVPASREGET